MMKKAIDQFVYEIVEVQNEQYFSLGFFFDYQSAKKVLTTNAPPTVDGIDHWVDYEIREHKIGSVGHRQYKTILRCQFDKKEWMFWEPKS